MPSTAQRYAPALLSEHDARLWNDGSTIATWGGVPWTHNPSTRWYDDAVAALNGRCSSVGRDLSADIAAVGTGLGPWSIVWASALSGTIRTALGITDTDRMVIVNGGEAFTLAASTDNAYFGFDNAGQASVLSGGVNYMAATGNWDRGRIRNRFLSLDPAGAGIAFIIPSVPYAAQSVPTMVRSTTYVDADDDHATDAFERTLNADVDAGSRRFRCFLNDDGYTVFAWPEVLGIGNPTWNNTAFRDFFGFTGFESYITLAGTAGNLRELTSTYRCQGALVIPATYSLRRLSEINTWEAETQRLKSGGVVVTRRLNRKSYSLTFILPGPSRPTDDLRRLAVDRFLPTLAPGDRLSIYLQWGDPRRVLRGDQVRSDPTGTAGQEAYTSFQTSQQDGERGRLVVRRGLSENAMTFAYPTGPRVELEVTMLFDEWIDA